MSSGFKPPTTQEEIEEHTARILKEVSGILDREQRSYALSKKLKRYPPNVIVEMFHLIAVGARFKQPLYQDGFRVISDVKRVAKFLGNSVMSQVYTLARSRGYSEVVAFMRVVPAARSLGEEEEIEEDPILKEMTLGLKRQKARMRDRDMIDRLCHEQDPMVIMHLLQNPSITLRQVIRIASKRPTGHAVLRVVYKDMRWVNHYVVKKALVNNPYTPTEISVSLLNFLLEQDLEDVAENMLLHKLVRHTAIDLIKYKRGLKKPTPSKRPEPNFPGRPASDGAGADPAPGETSGPPGHVRKPDALAKPETFAPSGPLANVSEADHISASGDAPAELSGNGRGANSSAFGEPGEEDARDAPPMDEPEE